MWGNFKFKTTTNQVRSVYRYQKPHRVVHADQIAFWWKRRVQAGCQLSNLEEYRKSYDYRGEPFWFRHVAMVALLEDFRKFYPGYISPLVFGGHLRSIVRHFKIVSKTGRLEKEDGSLFLRPARSYMRFEPIEIYRRSNENQTESEQE